MEKATLYPDLKALWSFTGANVSRPGQISKLFAAKFPREQFSLVTIQGLPGKTPLLYKGGFLYAVCRNGEIAPFAESGVPFYRSTVTIRSLVRESRLTQQQLITIYRSHEACNDRSNVRSLQSKPKRKRSRRCGFSLNYRQRVKCPVIRLERPYGSYESEVLKARAREDRTCKSNESTKTDFIFQNRQKYKSRKPSGKPAETVRMTPGTAPLANLSPRGLKVRNFG
jgi:hypothetical protein